MNEPAAVAPLRDVRTGPYFAGHHPIAPDRCTSTEC
jgi:hypothetical protein